MFRVGKKHLVRHGTSKPADMGLYMAACGAAGYDSELFVEHVYFFWKIKDRGYIRGTRVRRVVLSSSEVISGDGAGYSIRDR